MTENGNGQDKLAQARPMVVIQVVVGGQQQIYDVPTAHELLTELSGALDSLQAPETPEADVQIQETPEQHSQDAQE